MKLIDGYTEEMRESIKKVEKTRADRMKRSFAAMSMEERQDVLDKYHPDYKKERKRAVQIGPNKGEIAPHEVVDLLEAYPLITEKDIDLNKIDYDVDLLIIGGGGAGTVAALWANDNGIPAENILMVTKLRHGDANSMMAQGGIQAADTPEDSPARHYLDVIGGGHFANKPDLVEALVKDAPSILKWHEELGVQYDKDENGNYIERPGGGTSRFRLHSAKDYTGMEIMRVIRDEFRNRNIPVAEFSPAVELLKDDSGNVAGAVLFNMETEQYYVVRAKATVLATGGFGRLHIQGFPTTNHYGATADGLVMAYRAGAKLRDLDTVQYHPTGAAYPEQIVGLLITEKVRGMGAQPVNKDGELFVFPMEPRDVEAASFIRECANGKCVETPTGMHGIWLDSPMIEEIEGEGAIRRNLDAMYRMYKRFGIDMTKDPILVYPTLHYQNGGVEIDENALTTIPGLFAGGEVEGGVHGKNRLMGNSLLDYNVFGRRAGISAAQWASKNSKPGKLTLSHVSSFTAELEKAGIARERVSPMLLPDYRGENVIARMLDIL